MSLPDGLGPGDEPLAKKRGASVGRTPPCTLAPDRSACLVHPLRAKRPADGIPQRILPALEHDQRGNALNTILLRGARVLIDV